MSVLAAALLAFLPSPAPMNLQTDRIQTRWASLVDHQNPLPEYPRPQFVRDRWMSLNGPWKFTTDEFPTKLETITVPFPIESTLSGIGRALQPGQKATYQRSFDLPTGWAGERILLHFGAVDWEARVFVNGKEAGAHRGGFDPFTLDITRFLTASGSQSLEVWVKDPTDSNWIPRGKQVLKPGGIFYTPTSGIWQTVWLEPVPMAGIEGIRITPDVPTRSVTVGTSVWGSGAAKIVVEAFDGLKPVARAEARPGASATLKLPRGKLWSPESPFLYDLKVSALDANGKVIDEVKSYFGLRSCTVEKDSKGVNRLFLNGKPYFQIGLLDQGFWPDGLFTAPTDEALKYDLEVTKRLGFNMVRKHVKVEPARWYAHCDRLGLLVWQDMPSGDASIGSDDPDIVRSGDAANGFETELTRMIRALYNSPSIVTWVVFNEGWGQFQTAQMTSLTRGLDSSRVINAVTGWADRGVGDVIDYHIYPGPGSPKPEAARAAVLGEFGGLGLPLAGHTWISENNWGYQSFTTQAALTDALVNVIVNLRPLIADPGLSAAVYTQTTDVETEVNGIMTYDRAIIKPDEKRLRAALVSLRKPLPPLKTLVPTSEAVAQQWRVNEEVPPEGWEKSDFDDRSWPSRPGGFGRAGTPGAVIGTPWLSDRIWIRREFTGAIPAGSYLRIHHDEDADVFIDGVRVATLGGYAQAYSLVALPGAFPAGKHVLAIACKQTYGGQFIDAGILVP